MVQFEKNYHNYFFARLLVTVKLGYTRICPTLTHFRILEVEDEHEMEEGSDGMGKTHVAEQLLAFYPELKNPDPVKFIQSTFNKVHTFIKNNDLLKTNFEQNKDQCLKIVSRI